MYVLYAENDQAVRERSRLFDLHMEPMLRKLDAAQRSGLIPTELPEVAEYLGVCRWPFRTLEYSFALEMLLPHLKPGDRFLDAGSGVTPLAAVLAERGVQADACDFNEREIKQLQKLDVKRIYGVPVTYTWQDLTKVTFPDATFDAVTCISVIEHIPAPHDQTALRELMRIVKPGGVLVVTLDYEPPAPGQTSASGMQRYMHRVMALARQGNFKEISNGLSRKLQAQQAVAAGAARQPRSANQCYGVEHLRDDVKPLLVGEWLQSELPYSTDLLSVTSADARHFWALSGLSGMRDVLPVAFALRKSS